MKPSTMIVLALMVPALLGYLYYGWLLYQTAKSESNPWMKTLFATTFMFWLLPLRVLVLFAVMFWREKGYEEKKRAYKKRGEFAGDISSVKQLKA